MNKYVEFVDKYSQIARDASYVPLYPSSWYIVARTEFPWVEMSERGFYSLAFARYWKSAVTGQMSKNGVELSEQNIKAEMYKSIETFQSIYDTYKSVGYWENLNFKQDYKDSKIRGEYAEVLINEFLCGEPQRLNALKFGLRELQACKTLENAEDLEK